MPGWRALGTLVLLSDDYIYACLCIMVFAKSSKQLCTSGRKEIVAEFKVMVSSFPNTMSLMQQQLSKYKDTTSDVHSLRADVQSLTLVLNRKVCCRSVDFSLTRLLNPPIDYLCCFYRPMSWDHCVRHLPHKMLRFKSYRLWYVFILQFAQLHNCTFVILFLVVLSSHLLKKETTKT